MDYSRLKETIVDTFDLVYAKGNVVVFEQTLLSNEYRLGESMTFFGLHTILLEGLTTDKLTEQAIKSIVHILYCLPSVPLEEQLPP